MAKRSIVLCIICVSVAFCFLSIGYAALTDTLDIGGQANLTPPVYDTLVITDVTVLNETNVSSETHSRVIPTNVQTTISGSKGQSVIYRITAHNYSETDTFIFNGIKHSDVYEGIDKITMSIYSDESMTSALPVTCATSYVNGTPIEPDGEFTFYVKMTLDQNVNAETLMINYVFDTVKYTITYLADNELFAIDYIVNNQQPYYVDKGAPDSPESGNYLFVDWVNANAVPVDSYPAGNTNNYTLSAKWDSLYLIMFVDKDGNILYQEVFSTSSSTLSSEGQVAVNQILAELNSDAAKDEMSVAWSDYTIKNAKADIVVRPIYTYTGMLAFTPVDSDSDGIIDHYQVDAVSQLKDPVKIPGEHQGLPVKVVNKLYKNEDNFDYGAGIKTIEIGEGVVKLERNSLAYTADLETVYLPNSLEYIGKNAFSRNWSNDKKEITIYYNGTMAEWKVLVANSHEDWANGITTRSGSKVMCTDGYFEYDNGFIGIGAKWEEHKY